MNYNSKRGVDAAELAHYMLQIIQDISKKSDDFNQLKQLLPLMLDLRKADIDNKQIGQSLKVISDLLPKLKSKVFPSKGTQSVLQIYQRMIQHLNIQVHKLNSQYENISSKSGSIASTQMQQLKIESAVIIKEIEQLLSNNKKIVTNTINTKRKEYIGQYPKIYLYRRLSSLFESKGTIKSNLQDCKYQFGEFRTKYRFYQKHGYSHELKADIIKLQQGRESGMNEQMLLRLENKINLQHRKQFVIRSEQHIKKQYTFVVKNLKKFENLKGKIGKFEQNLYLHYLGWGKRIKVTLQSIILKLFEQQSRQVLTKQQQIFLNRCKNAMLYYQSLLQQLNLILS